MRNASRSRWGPALAAAFAVTLVATACGGGNGDDPGTDDSAPVELTFSWWGNDSRHEQTQQIIDAFEAKHENIKIVPDFTDWNSYWDRLSTAAAGNRLPDILTQEERYLREYASRGQLLDLNTVTDQLDLSNIDPLALGGGEMDGALYGVATGVNAFTIVADPQIFADAGVDMPDDGTWTWQDFIDISVEISENGDAFGAQALGTNEAGFNVYARQRGEQLYNPDGSIGFSAQTLADWWSVFLEQIERGGAPDASTTVEVGAGGPDLSLLATNGGAMGFWWTNQLGGLASAADRDLVLLRQPGEADGQRPGMYLKPAMFYSASSQTEHPQEAALFIDFLLNDIEAAEIMLTDRGLPANLQIREQIAPSLDEANAQSAEFIAEIAPGLVDPPPPPPTGAGETVSIIQRLFEEVLFERMTPLEAAEQFIQEVETATR